MRLKANIVTYCHKSYSHIPYRTKIRRTKFSKSLLGVENFVQRKILSVKYFSIISIQKSGKNWTKMSKFRLGIENFVRKKNFPMKFCSIRYIEIHKSAFTVIERLQSSGAEVRIIQNVVAVIDRGNINTSMIEIADSSLVNSFALWFLNRSFIKYIVESLVLNLEGVFSGSLNLDYEIAEKLNFISSNGPHLLCWLTFAEAKGVASTFTLV